MNITELLGFSAQQGASDLHLSVGLPPMIGVKVAQMYSAIQTGQAIGMQTMDQCLQALVEKRIITVDAAREKAREPYSIAL
jgi:Tfp pilus assembly pilus retraction ATPase PilT